MEVDLVDKTVRMARSYRLGYFGRAANLEVTGMIRLGVGFSSSYLLTTTGRKTRASRTTPVASFIDEAARHPVFSLEERRG